MNDPGSIPSLGEWIAEAEELQAKLLLAVSDGPQELRRRLLERLVPRDFLKETMREEFSAIHAQCTAVDAIEVTEATEETEEKEEAPPDPVFEEMVRRLAHLSGIIRITELLRQTEAAIQKDPMEYEAALERLQRETSAELARQAILKVTPKVWRNSKERTFDLIESVENICLKRNAAGTLEWSGLPSLNVLAGNLQPGRFYLLGAAPGEGKTAFLASLARRVAHCKHRVGILSFRDSEENISLRIFAGESRLNPVKLRKGELVYENFVAMTTAASAMADWLPAIVSLPHAGVGQVCALIRQLCAAKRLELVMLDDLDYADLPGEAAGCLLEKINRFVQLARELNLPLVGSVSLGSPLFLSLNENRPAEDLLRFSDADVFAVLQRKPEAEFGTHEIQVLRNALGPTGEVPLFFKQTNQHYWEIKE